MALPAIYLLSEPGDQRALGCLVAPRGRRHNFAEDQPPSAAAQLSVI